MVGVVSIFGSCIIHVPSDLLMLVAARSWNLVSIFCYFQEVFLAGIWETGFE